jgi:capsular polysaccharide transport system ATP-binding protein
MIDFHGVSKSYQLRGSRRHILRDLTLAFPRDKNVALIGRNGAGKSTLLGMIAGTVALNKGRIVRHGRMSWPMGFSGGIHPALTGRQNARFIARVYGADTGAMVDFVEDFSELGAFLDMPTNTYSSGMKARLSFGISLAANFDCYLIDELTEVGDAAFREKCRRAFQDKMREARVIVAAHSEATLKSMCNAALLIEAGTAVYFDTVEDGLAAYRALIGV